MRSAGQFLLFQALWFAAVLGAARGMPWLGAMALVPYLVWQLVGARPRWSRLLRWFGAGGLGAALDCLLHRLDLLRYPHVPAGWPDALVPPFIVVLWIAFATLPSGSLAWLRGRPGLAALLGAAGGPLSFLGGARLGAVAPGPSPAWSALALALEYALVTPLFVAALAVDDRAPRRA